MRQRELLIGMSGLGIVFVFEYLTQIGVGRYPVTAILYAGQILASGHLAGIPYTDSLTWESFKWIDSALPLPSILIASFSKVVGIPLTVMDSIPLGTLLLIPFYTLALRLTRRIWFAVFFVFGFLFLSYGFVALQQINRVSMGWDLLGALLLILFTQRSKSVAFGLTSTLLIIALGLTYYTASAIALAVVASLAIYTFILGRFPTEVSWNGGPIPQANLGTLLVAAAGLTLTPALYVTTLSGFHFSSLGQFAVVFGSFFSNLAYHLGLSPLPAYPQINNIPIPLYLQQPAVTIIKRTASAAVELPVLLWGSFGLVSILRGRRDLLKIYAWEFAGSLCALSILLVSIIGYGGLNGRGPLGNELGSIGIIGVLLLNPPQRKVGRRSVKMFVKIISIAAIIIVVAGSAINIGVDASNGFTGVFPHDGSLYSPVSHWYGSYSSSSDLASANFVLSSILALYSNTGLATPTLAENTLIASSLASMNATSLNHALRARGANVYAFSLVDENRPSWGDAYGYVATGMSYSSWFYNLPSTNIIYTSGKVGIDYLGIN